MILAELDNFVVTGLTFVDEALKVALAAGAGLAPEAALLVGAERNEGLDVVLEVLEADAADALDDALAHHGAANLEVGRIEADDTAVGELERAGPAQPGNKCVASHFADELVVAGHAEAAVGPFEQVVRNGRVVRGVFAVVARAVAKAALVGFAEQRVEGLALPRADVQTGQLKSDDALHPFDGVALLTSRYQLGAGCRPKVDHSLHTGPVLENLDGQRNVRDGQAFEQVDGQLFGHVRENPTLLVEHFLVSAQKPSIFLVLYEAFQNLRLVRGKLLQQLILAKIEWRRALRVPGIAPVRERVGPARIISFPAKLQGRLVVIFRHLFVYIRDLHEFSPRFCFF